MVQMRDREGSSDGEKLLGSSVHSEVKTEPLVTDRMWRGHCTETLANHLLFHGDIIINISY